MKTLDLAALVADLDRLAFRTWEWVYSGPRVGLEMREETITEVNLLELQVRHPAVSIRKFSTSEESRNGADWEWWTGSDATGWLGMRIQAKKLSEARYKELRYRSDLQMRIQCEVLVDEVRADAQGRALFPYYCFYNGWDHTLGWPKDTPWKVGCSKPANCATVPDVRVFGCALAPAADVLDVVRGNRRALRKEVTLPLQHPWSWYFGGHPLNGAVSDVWGILRSLVGPTSSDAPAPSLFEELPPYARAVRDRREPSELRQFSDDVPTAYVMVGELRPGDPDGVPAVGPDTPQRPRRVRLPRSQ
jgi:hypothetical protein